MLSSAWRSLAIGGASWSSLRQANVIHLHSNGLLPEVCGRLSSWLGKPTVLTLYGTEVWHYEPRWLDLFARMHREAAHVAFYSRALLERAEELGLRQDAMSVIYPPAADAFTWHDQPRQAAARQALGLRERFILLNVKRLHPLAGQRQLIEAMPAIIRALPDTRLLICGDGPLRSTLEQLAAACDVAQHVTFLGQVENQTVAEYCAAADLFVLPSVLEACPTVAVEALACGTPVVSADNPGGLELNALFGTDVHIVPKEQPAALASRVIDLLPHRRRAAPSTRERVEREFRPPRVWAQYRDVYAAVVG